jgi:hypothetical protein
VNGTVLCVRCEVLRIGCILWPQVMCGNEGRSSTGVEVRRQNKSFVCVCVLCWSTGLVRFVWQKQGFGVATVSLHQVNSERLLLQGINVRHTSCAL